MALFCDDLVEGRLGASTILGVVETIVLDEVSVGQIRTLVAVILAQMVGLAGEHTLRLTFIAPGEDAGESKTYRKTFTGREDAWFVRNDFMIELGGLVPGRYRMQIDLDGESVGFIPLRVQSVLSSSPAKRQRSH